MIGSCCVSFSLPCWMDQKPIVSCCSFWTRVPFYCTHLNYDWTTYKYFVLILQKPTESMIEQSLDNLRLITSFIVLTSRLSLLSHICVLSTPLSPSHWPTPIQICAHTPHYPLFIIPLKKTYCQKCSSSFMKLLRKYTFVCYWIIRQRVWKRIDKQFCCERSNKGKCYQKAQELWIGWRF